MTSLEEQDAQQTETAWRQEAAEEKLSATQLARELLETRGGTVCEYQAVIRACRKENLHSLADMFAEFLLLAQIGGCQVWTRRDLLTAVDAAEKQEAGRA